MGRKIWFFVVFVLLLAIIIIGYLLVFFGLKDYLSAKWQISQLTPEDRVKAEEWLYRIDTENAYSGILASASNDVIWVWGARGLRRFVASEGPAYSLFVACDKVSSGDEEKNSYSISKKVVGEMGEWKAKIHSGNYVEILFPPGQEVNTNYYEVNGYDWWIFLPKTMEEQCAR